MTTKTTVKDAPAIVTLDVNAANIRSQDSRQYTNMNNGNMVEAGNDTELIFMKVILLLTSATQRGIPFNIY